LHWIRVAQSEVKRDMEMERDEVRVMTVHGAKGLEAKNVILIDSTTVRPEGAYTPRLLTTSLASGSAALIWGGRQALDAGPMPAARTTTLDAARDEYRRLLYVGMTRAAERLVVCATRGVKEAPEECWYNLVREALKPPVTEETTDSDGDRIWRLRKGDISAAPRDITQSATAQATPEWLKRPAASPLPRRRVITPSDSSDDEPTRFAGPGDRDKALRRGTLFHRLMQSLPDVTPKRRAGAARAFLVRDNDLSETEHEEMMKQVFAILDDPHFSPLFSPGSRAEVSLGGLVGNVQVPGQIDRIAVTDNDVLIADYKTNRPPPSRIADVPAAYVRQLALYRTLLRQIFPHKNVRAALLWTETPELMELSAQAMDAALAQVTSA
jgi:ATP-dependent helicase/nuclease subunit A